MDNNKVQRVLGLAFTEEEKSMVDAGYACLEHRLKGIEQTKEFKDYLAAKAAPFYAHDNDLTSVDKALVQSDGAANVCLHGNHNHDGEIHKGIVRNTTYAHTRFIAISQCIGKIPGQRVQCAAYAKSRLASPQM